VQGWVEMGHEKMVETTVMEENNVRQYLLDEKLETFSACLAEYWWRQSSEHDDETQLM